MIRRVIPAGLSTRASPAMAATVAWARERSRREQILLAFFGGFLALTVFWLLIPRPLLEARATAIARIETYETVKARLAGNAAAGRPAPVTGPIETVLTTRATAVGLAPAVTREDGDLVVSVTDARYDAVVPWLAALEAEQGLTLSRVTIEQRPTPGTVNVAFRIAE